MKSVQGELFTGYKSVRLEDLPEEAWRIVVGPQDAQGIERLYGIVSWLYRCVDVRAGAVANMPWEIRKGETVIMTQEDEAPEVYSWLDNLSELLYKTEAAVALTGRAYWFRERNLLRTLDVRWLLPGSVTPDIGEDGLRGFERRLSNRTLALEPDDLVYFWLPDPLVELGPAKNYPGLAAMNAAGVLASMDVFLGGYFDRGMIKATLLKYTQSISPEESKRVKEWWQRVTAGVKNAFSALIIRGDFEPLIIGEGLKDLQNTALTAEEREAIATAMGVPQSKAASNAANFATKEGDDKSFIEDKIAPECRWLASVINRQLLRQMGLRLVFKPETLSIMQEDEEQRAGSLKSLVDAGMSLEMALEILGYDLPEGFELREPKAATPPQLMPFTGQPQPAGPPTNDEVAREVARFRRWAKHRANPDPEQFESVILTVTAKTMLLDELAEGAVGDDAPFRASRDASGPFDWQGYP